MSTGDTSTGKVGATQAPAQPTTSLDAVAAPVGWRALLRRVWADRNGRLGILLTTALVVAAAVATAGWLPYDPVAHDTTSRLQPPSGAHWFGTDQFGRDVATRTAVGIAASLRVAVVAVAIATVVGAALGIVAGFAGGLVDAVVGRLADVMFAFPAILLALAIVAALGHGWQNTAVAIAVVYTPIFIRVARGPTLSVVQQEYVKAGIVLGFSPIRLLVRHVLPNVSAPIVVQVMLALAWAILTESGLSFLGLGTQPPEPSLGLMVEEARNLVTEAWWTLTFPAMVIVVSVIALNLLGDGLRHALDPRSHA